MTDLDGNPVGGGEITTSTGVFSVSNLPPGLINLAIASGDDSGNEVVRVYPNGITFFELMMAKVIPARVSVPGIVRGLDGLSTVGQAQLKVLGRQGLIAANGIGEYKANLESFGQFVIKAEKAGFYDTYNFFPAAGVIDASNNLDLFSISRDETNFLATDAGIPIDRANGVIAGTTVKNSLQPNPITAAIDTGSHSAVLGYFNRDSLVDIAVTVADPNPGLAGKVKVLFGDSNGSFANAKEFTVGKGPSAIVAGNFDGNGNLDLVVANTGDNSITVLLGDKNGDFTSVDVPLVDDQQKPLSPPPFNGPVALAVGFFDSDNFSDIAVVDQNHVIVLLGNGNGTFHPIYQNSSIVRNAVEANPTAIVAGDFNQDNRLDMAISNASSNSISILLGSTDGTFQPLSDPNTGAPIVIQGVPNPQAMTLFDANSDGRLDLAVVSRSQGTVTILIGNVSGGFDTLKDSNGKVLAPIDVGTNPSALTIGEFNGDNRIDLAVTREGSLTDPNDQSVLPLLGNGNGTFTPSTPVSLGDLTEPRQILLEDADRNGLFDLIVVGSTKIISLMGKEDPVGGVSVEARNLEGTRVGTVVYPGSTSKTSADGRFMIFNVPPGITLVRNTGQGAGNKMIDTYPDSVSYTKIKTLAVQPFLVSVQGVTYDPVGPPPAGVPVGAVNIHLFGMDVKTKSDNTTGSYKFDVDANSEYILRLFFDLPSRATP
jgi:hypothetical protein